LLIQPPTTPSTTQVDSLEAKIEQQKEIIAQQMNLLQITLDEQKQRDTDALDISIDNDIITTYNEKSSKLDEERLLFTQAAIKMGKERAQFQVSRLPLV